MNRKETFTFNCNTDFPDLWIVESVKSSDETDKIIDGQYPLKVGCTVAILLIDIGKPLVCSCLADANGNKEGLYQSGQLIDVFYVSETQTLYANSQNIYYVLKKLPPRRSDICVESPKWYPDYLRIPKFNVPENKCRQVFKI